MMSAAHHSLFNFQRKFGIQYVQLTVADEKEISKAATKSLLDLPDSIVDVACRGELPPAILHKLATLLKNEELLGNLVN